MTGVQTCALPIYEVAFIERFGSPRLSAGDAARGLEASVFRPGYYLKMPWMFGPRW